ncbi:MAG: hypothetical protein ABIV63_17620 [Caldimonas sp.]
MTQPLKPEDFAERRQGNPSCPVRRTGFVARSRFVHLTTPTDF